MIELTQTQTETLLKTANIVAFWLGMAARAVLPYLKAYWEQGGGLPFDWAYVKGQAVGSLVAFLGLLAAGGNVLLAEIGALGIGLAFLTGYFSAQIGREGQKFTGAARSFWRMP